MKNGNAKSSGRIYFFDWLRAIAFLAVVSIHCIQMFGDLYKPFGSTPLGNGVRWLSLNGFTYWSMALFFLLAGASSWFALKRRTAGAFIKERFQRLLVPFGIGFVLLVPLQAYFDMISNQLYNGSLLAFYPYFLGDILRGNLGLITGYIHHLWFIVYLFGFSLLTLPLCLYLRGAGQRWLNRISNLSTTPAGLFALALPLLLIECGLRTAFPQYCSLTDALSWTLYYMYGFILFASPRPRQMIQKTELLTTGLTVAGSIALICLWKLGGAQVQTAYTPGYMLFRSLCGLTLWCSLLMTLALGDRFLNRSNSFLQYSCKASFPWYLVHFPLVVILAYCLLPLHMGFLVTFALLITGSLLLTLLVSDLLLLQASGTRAILAAQAAVRQTQLARQATIKLQPLTLRTQPLSL
ncbi:acyltransferase-like protein [Thermosporothrix hazakensis]|jgi:peptidoglycan/LPS O-acetylase OafA/YrhL|uniref:Acyltransferase-like protein n=2 Tax=Thermosporothrix TaxID=768650 RepID=A0A326UI11_THEHA|nr:acyltransferase [Thermosporothrix hazakensis]PZW27919.1 acyltransferase-like protein [Thermosporothrix hazakensis]BBH86848.1 hypothetical protein KTC_15990 [Thermosporothrix sp. COM3]GCE51144.1 hypothetical protein KTH_60130 [Thermosporothrix hazakensis]